MRDLTSQKPSQSSFAPSGGSDDRPDVVRGAYQPVGKVDINEIRRQAKESGQLKDERPETVKGSYEPVGKVDIAAIKARSQKPESAVSPSAGPAGSPGREEEQPPSLAQRSAAFSQASPLTSLPKPKIANKFGGSAAFTGTKAPVPGGFAAKSAAPTPPVGVAKNFGDQGGKTPAQIWAEKKARERGTSGSGTDIPGAFPGAASLVEQKSGNTGWQSGYSGKKWGSVETQRTGKSSIPEQRTGEPPAEEEETPGSPAGGISSIRDRFSGAAPMGAPSPSTFDRAPPPAPEPETSTKPNRGVPIPGMSTSTRDEDQTSAPAIPPPPAVPRSPTPETPERESSPIRVANPISKAAPVQDAHEEIMSPPPAMPTQSLNRAVPEPDPEDDEPETGPDPSRQTAQAGAPTSPAAGGDGGERARAEYDYDAAEDNEVSFMEGEILTDIQKVDPDWWLVVNSKGQQGLVPANYLTIIEDDEPMPTASQKLPDVAPTSAAAPPAPAAAEEASEGKTAVALYDYEAGEDNEISFPEEAIITNIVRTTIRPWSDHANFNRNSLTTTGGMVNTKAKLDFSHLPMSSFGSDQRTT